MEHQLSLPLFLFGDFFVRSFMLSFFINFISLGELRMRLRDVGLTKEEIKAKVDKYMIETYEAST